VPGGGGGDAGDGGAGGETADGGAGGETGDGGAGGQGERSAGLPGSGGGGSGEDGEDGAGGDGDEGVFGGSGDGGQRSAGSGGGGDEFDRALEDFDNVIAGEQEAIAREGGGAAADEAVASSSGPGGLPGAPGGGATGEPGERAIIGGPTGSPPPERTAAQVEGCNDEDTVARQLCEAATKEQDPFLRAALWDEYNEYKRILGRQ
jgi:hypothetical protein